MSDWLFWLLTVEILGLAALPLASYLFRAFPDRGYGLSKPLGILLVAFVNWWLGSVLKLGNYPPALWALALLLAAGGILFYRKLAGLQFPFSTNASGRSLLGIIAIEEALFLVAFIFWTYVRAQNADIYETEKPMDFMLLQVSGMTHSFPPPDAWLSGHTVNYYYLGYAIYAMIGNMAGVDARFGFNLANITIFAMGCSAGYSLALSLTRSRLWAFAGVFLVMLAGDLDALSQAISQLQNGGLTSGGLNLFCSTRIVDSANCSNYTTITEFPIFSVLWNDLHPHIMALPFALLAIGIAISAFLGVPDGEDERIAQDQPLARYLWLILAAVILGALFPLNSWDYPPYLVLGLAALFGGAYRRGQLTMRRGWEIAAVLPASLLLYLPYYLTVHLAGQGHGLLGFNASPSDLGQMLIVIGGLLIPMALFAAWQLAAALIDQNSTLEGQQRPPLSWLADLPIGAGWWALGVLALALVALPARADLLLLLVILSAGYTLWTRLRSEEPEHVVALALAFLGALLLLLVEYFYLRDNFDNGPSYRMNTMFKLYYQAWLLLSVGAAYAVAAITRALTRAPRGLLITWSVALGLAAAMLAVYPVWGVGSLPPRLASTPGLDGLAYLQLQDTTDYAAITWIRQNLPANAVIAEADGVDTTKSGCGEYWVCGPLTSYNHISALTGRPTVLGWPGSHEALWRGADSLSLLTDREQDVRTLYTTTDVQRARQIISKYQIDYVYVGPLEQETYVSEVNAPQAALTKFGTFLKPVHSWSGAVLYAAR